MTSGGIQLANVVTGILLARSLGAHDRGALAAVLLWPVMLAALGSLGLGSGTTYFAAREEYPIAAVVGTALALGAVLSLLLVATGFVIAPMVLSHYGHGVVVLAQVFLLFIPLNVATLVFTGALGGAQSFGRFQLVRVSPVAVNLLLLAALAGLGAVTVGRATLVYLASNVATVCVAGWLYLRTAGPAFSLDARLARKLLGFGVKSHVGNVSSSLNSRLDQLLISVFLAPATLGIYVVAVTLSSATTLIGSSIEVIAFPRLAHVGGDGRVGAARRFVLIAVVGSVVVTAPILLLTPQLLKLLFGSQFVAAAPAARILLVAGVIYSVNRVLGAVLTGFGLPLAQGIAELLALVVTAGSLALLLPRFGLMGAAVASLLAYATSMAWMAFRLQSLRADRIRRAVRQGTSLADAARSS